MDITIMSGLSHVCRNDMLFHRRKRDLAFLRFECGFETWVACFSSAEELSDRWLLSVANAGALVSPRGSAPRLLPPRGRPIVGVFRDRRK